MKTLTGPDPMSARQAAAMLGIQVASLSRMRRQGRITGIPKRYGYFEYARAEVERVLNGGAK